MTTYCLHTTATEEEIRASEPEPPKCEPPTPDLGQASIVELERAWDVPAWMDGDHVWASPYGLLGGPQKNPRVLLGRGRVVVKEVCLRCGTLRSTGGWATDPEAGKEELWAIEYEPGRYADQVEDAWYARGGPRRDERVATCGRDPGVLRGSASDVGRFSMPSDDR